MAASNWWDPVDVMPLPVAMGRPPGAIDPLPGVPGAPTYPGDPLPGQPDPNPAPTGSKDTSAPTPAPTAGGAGSIEEFGRAWLASGSADLKGFVAQWNQQHPGLQATLDAKKGHNVTIGGQSFHALNSDGNKFWFTGGSDSGTSASGSSTSAMPSLTYQPFVPPPPFTEQFSYPQFAEQFSYPTWTEKFTAPTADQVFQDPIVQAQLQLSNRAINNSAAAKGTLLTSGTLKDLSNNAQTVGATYGGDVYNRALQQYGLDYQNYLGNYGRSLGEYQQRYGQYEDTRNQALQEFQQRYGIYGDTFNRDLAANAQQFGQGLQTAYYGLGAQNQGFNQGLQSSYLDLFGQNQGFNQGLQGSYLDLFGQNQGFNQQFNLANLGLNATNSSNANALGWAQLAGNTSATAMQQYLEAIYGGANANAGGRAGSANAWSSALGGIGNLLSQAALAYGSGYGRSTPRSWA